MSATTTLNSGVTLCAFRELREKRFEISDQPLPLARRGKHIDVQPRGIVEDTSQTRENPCVHQAADHSAT